MSSLIVIATLLASVGMGNTQRDIPGIILINASAVDPYEEGVGPPFLGDKELYVWPTTYESTEITFGLTGSLAVVELYPDPGWTNTGTLSSPHLVYNGSCVPAPFRACKLVVRDVTGLGGRVCIDESVPDSLLCFIDCTGYYISFDYAYGYRTDGDLPCYYVRSTECGSTDVTAESWGRLKATYR